eukprot:4587449-Prymnesium_polylepis.1
MALLLVVPSVAGALLHPLIPDTALDGELAPHPSHTGDHERQPLLRQYPEQTEAMREIQRIAFNASSSATPALLALLSLPSVREILQNCCSGAAAWSSEYLLDELRARFHVAEILHTFDGQKGEAD